MEVERPVTKWLPWLVTSLAASLVAVGIAGCDCNVAGCVNGVEVAFEPAEGWAPGTYRIQLETPDGGQHCEITQPSPPLPASVFGNSPCRLDLRVFHTQEGGVQVALLLVEEAHSWVIVEVSRNGEVLGRLEEAPEYVTVEPNGEQCEPTCRYGGRYVLAVEAVQ